MNAWIDTSTSRPTYRPDTDASAKALTAMALRLQLALEQLPWHTPDLAETLHRWLGLMLGPEGLDRWYDLKLGISLTADLRGLTWHIEDEAEVFIPRLAHYFELADVAEAELDRVAQAGTILQPEQLEGWIEVYDGALNVGWAFPQPLPLIPALDQLTAGPMVTPLINWAARHDVTLCTRAGRAVGGEHPYADLQISLRYADVDRQLEAGLDAFAALDIAPPPPPVADALRHAAKPGLTLSVWLSATGVVKLGLITPKPSIRDVMRLFHATNHRLDETWAAFEGALDVSGPSGVEAQRFADGCGLTSHYTLLNLKPS